MYLYYVKIGLSFTLLIAFLGSLIYSLILLFQFWAKRLTKQDVIKKTFIVIFCGFMAMFLTVFVWQAEWNIAYLTQFLVFSVSLSLVGAFASIASFLTRKE